MIKAIDFLIDRFIQSRDDVLLIESSGKEYTYGQVWDQANLLANQWKAQGACRGDTIALILPNGPSFVLAYIACINGGYIAAPVNLELPHHDIEDILSLVRPRIVVSDKFDDQINNVLYEIEHTQTIPSDIATLFFTSGTTGKPKGVCHTLDALVGNVVSFNKMFDIGPETRMYHVLPMSYMAGFLNTILSPIAAGGSVVIAQRFSPQTILDFWTLARQHHAQTLWITPSIAVALQRIARDPVAAIDNATDFKHIFCGTAPLQDAVKKSFEETFGMPLQESYGTSELLLISAQSYREALRFSDVGRPLPELSLDTLPDQDRIPELVVNSPFAFWGYLTECGFIEVQTVMNGFIRTGDAAELRNGHLVITGRLKDLIIRGGVNIIPAVIENALIDLSGISDVAVIGVPHTFWGESITVCIEIPANVDKPDLISRVRRRCLEKLARFCQPDDVRLFSEFPRSNTGKIQKSVLRTELVQ